jgi:alpha-amylase
LPGEFDQKGSVRTKYGTKEQLLKMMDACKKAGVQVYLDTVFNHKFGAVCSQHGADRRGSFDKCRKTLKSHAYATTQDELEQVEAQPIDWNNRNQVVGDMKTIGAYTKFTFPGRKVV